MRLERGEWGRPGTDVGRGGRECLVVQGASGPSSETPDRLSLALAPVATPMSMRRAWGGKLTLLTAPQRARFCLHMDYSGAQHSSPPLVCIRRYTLYTLSWVGTACFAFRACQAEQFGQTHAQFGQTTRLARIDASIHSVCVFTHPAGTRSAFHQTPSHLCTNATTTSLVYVLGIFPACGVSPRYEKVLYKSCCGSGKKVA